jgi:hypothetical protein
MKEEKEKKMMGVLRNNLVACVFFCILISLVVVNKAGADIFEDANLVGYWQFNNDTPDDSSPLGNDGTFVGDASSEKDVLELDGVGDYVDCANDTSLLPDAWTVSAWIKIEDNNDQAIISFGSPYVALNMSTLGKPGVFLGLTNWRLWTTSAYDALKDNYWHHVVFSIPGADQNDVNSAKMYIDVEEQTVDTTVSLGPQLSKTVFRIGTSTGSLGLVEGLVDEVILFDRVLNEYEILQLYEQDNKRYGHFNEVTGDVFRGSNCTASGTKSVAFGDGTEASGDYSFAAGQDANAIGYASTAMGIKTVASGQYSTAMGYLSRATTIGSLALGYNAEASGLVSISIGTVTTASGLNSLAMGNYTTASETNSSAFGEFSINNVADSFTVGYGSQIGYEQVDFRVRSGQVNVYGDLDVDDDLDVTDTVTMGTLVLPVKTTTGDPASPVEGQIYVNTSDNKVRVYADGAWRDLAMW